MRHPDDSHGINAHRVLRAYMTVLFTIMLGITIFTPTVLTVLITCVLAMLVAPLWI